jgi:hypothetical protein
VTPDIALWVFGIALAPAFAAAVAILGLLRDVKKTTDRLLYMHDHPSEFGFGTGGFKEALRSNTRAMRELSHFVRWSSEQTAGKSPPPFVDLEP